MKFQVALAFAALSVAALAYVQGLGVAASPEAAKPIQPPAKAPDAKIKSLDGKSTTVREALGGKPTVLIFYRGGWCPFCNAHLADLAKVEGDIRKRGYQIVAISPDTPEELNKTLDKDHLTYKLYSDSSADAMKAYGVAFRLDDETFSKYKNQYHIDIERSSGQMHHILPVPSVFLVNPKGEIFFTHSNPDYKVRMKGAEILDAIDQAR